MKKVILLFLILVSCKSKQVVNQQKINVLMIGNSLTYYHNMPTKLQEMLNEDNSNFNVEQSAFPGQSLTGLLNDIITERVGDDITTIKKRVDELTETEKKIAQKKWDFVIMQEHPSYFYFSKAIDEFTNPSIKKIKELTKNPNCKFILFSTWAINKNYPLKKNCLPKIAFEDGYSETDTLCSYFIKDLDDEIKYMNISFDKISKENNIIISNHYLIHQKLFKEYPNISLYESDGHPIECGSFLNACVFYKLLTNKKPSKLKTNGNLDFKTAKILKKISD